MDIRSLKRGTHPASSSPMRLVVSFLFALLLSAVPVVAQSPTSDSLSILKNIPSETQQSLLQGVLGSGKLDGTNRKTDPLLKTPDTINQRIDGADQYDKYVKGKTQDGHTLRMPDEDLELRADDSVLIDLVAIERRQRPVVPEPVHSASGAGTNAVNGVSLPQLSSSDDLLNGNQKSQKDKA